MGNDCVVHSENMALQLHENCIAALATRPLRARQRSVNVFEIAGRGGPRAQYAPITNLETNP
jgi:hypothetical protein